MMKKPLVFLSILLSLVGRPLPSSAATSQERYYAHPAVEDEFGVIAPWYEGQNGLVDERVRVAAEFLKRYPWVDDDSSLMAGPHWVFNARVDLAADGAISVLPATDNMNGNLGQRFKYITEALPRYYRYSGDPALLGALLIAGDFLLENYLTPEDHPWPRFPISVPQTGTPYGKAAPGGWIQLDLSAGIGLGFLRIYELSGETRFLEAAGRIGDVFASKCSLEHGRPPWNRYAEGGESPWGKTATGNQLTGGVANILIFLEELVRLGYTGDTHAILRARDAGRDFLRDSLLPRWTQDDTWGRHYWDWEHPVQGILPTGWVAQYLMDHPDIFPNWRNDVRNMLSLYLNHACVSPHSNGDVYSGAWAFPEGSSCCGRSLDICPVFLGRFWARYAVEAQSQWAQEIVRRMTLLGFYHFHDNGMVEDNIDGGQITAREWSELIGFGPVLCGLEIAAWLPDLFGPARENHLLYSSSLVRDVKYGDGRIEYSTFDAPVPNVDVIRLAFLPEEVRAGDRSLPLLEALNETGYTAEGLDCGDWIIRVRHDGSTRVAITGEDPQVEIDDSRLTYQGEWEVEPYPEDFEGGCHVADSEGAVMVHRFHGNQVRVLGRSDPRGGVAKVFLDGARQSVGIDCWMPTGPKYRQVLYHRSGLANATHEIRIEASGESNPLASGKSLFIDAIQSSSQTAPFYYGSGGGPTQPQRMIFGYPGREPFIDREGNPWFPGTEFVVRSGDRTDSVATAWWTDPSTGTVSGTNDPELYRYGIHASEFWVNATVGPGIYDVRLKLAERRDPADAARQPMKVTLNGDCVEASLEVSQRAGGDHRSLDLHYSDIRPRNGVIEVRCRSEAGEAILQALEIVPTGAGAQ